jgi:hypothetical protein
VCEAADRLAARRSSEWIAAQMGNSSRVMEKHYGRFFAATDDQNGAEVDAFWASSVSHRTKTGHEVSS